LPWWAAGQVDGTADRLVTEQVIHTLTASGNIPSVW
jgi:hypothetical protein